MRAAASARRSVPATQIPLATRKEQLASLASRVDRRVGNVSRALVNGAGKGFASELAATMGWRIERRSREINGTEKLSLSDVVAEIELHLVDGAQEAADSIISALIDGLRTSAVPITPGSVIRVFDDHGQLYMRFDR